MPYSWIRNTLLSLSLLFSYSLVNAQVLNCHSQYKGQTLDSETISLILNHHQRTNINLCGVILNHTNLTNFNLSHADLSGSDISHVDAPDIDLSFANLSHVFFRWSNLANSHFASANLQNANLADTNLNKADFSRAYMTAVNLQNADLQGANLSYANLEGANLSNANLAGADLRWANLTNADLSNANLQDAYLEGTFLISANLQDSNLTNAVLTQADLRNAVYQPKLGTLPDLISFLSVKHFHTIHFQDFNNSRASLTELRNAYMTIGIKSMQHQLTSIIKYNEMVDGWSQGGWQWVESTLGFFFFYITCDYGAAPVKPIEILLISIFIFALPYRIALSRASKSSGIVVIWLPNRFSNWNKVKTVLSLPLMLSKLLNNHLIGRKIHFISTQVRLMTLALFFSLISAFSIGWKEINVGNWVSHLQSREFTLKGKGWVRTVAGFQSLLSAYLIVLWILCYFGRPFEW